MQCSYVSPRQVNGNWHVAPDVVAQVDEGGAVDGVGGFEGIGIGIGAGEGISVGEVSTVGLGVGSRVGAAVAGWSTLQDSRSR